MQVVQRPIAMVGAFGYRRIPSRPAGSTANTGLPACASLRRGPHRIIALSIGTRKTRNYRKKAKTLVSWVFVSGPARLHFVSDDCNTDVRHSGRMLPSHVKLLTRQITDASTTWLSFPPTPTFLQENPIFSSAYPRSVCYLSFTPSWTLSCLSCLVDGSGSQASTSASAPCYFAILPTSFSHVLCGLPYVIMLALP